MKDVLLVCDGHLTGEDECMGVPHVLSATAVRYHQMKPCEERVAVIEARLKEAEELLRRAAGRPWNPASKDIDKDIAAFLRGAK